MDYMEMMMFLVLVFFASLSLLICGYTMSNVFRLRRVRLSWKSGKLFGYPIFATAFVLFCSSLIIGMIWSSSFEHMNFAIGYLLSGIAWMSVSLMSGTRYITDHGIVKNVNDVSQTLPWHQVIDFMENETEDGARFTFFYLNEGEDGHSTNMRLELPVPKKHYAQFTKILSQQLGRRFNASQLTSDSIKQFK
jgi:hypothetical protein